MRRLLIVLVVLSACREDVPPPKFVQARPSPEPQAQHPVYRYPARVDPNDPIRDPAIRARLIKSTEPEYSPEARKQRISGLVILEVVVEPDGRISGGKVLKPLPAGLTQQAIKAVEHWRYLPAEDPAGKPVRSIVNLTVHFRLR